MKEPPMPRGLYYVLENKKVRPAKSRDEFENFFANKKHVVRQDTIKGLLVSTAFLGIRNPFSGCIFETMVLDKNRENLFSTRYKTYAQAEKGHKEILALVQSGEIK